jgi:hypothetical protein
MDHLTGDYSSKAILTTDGRDFTVYITNRQDVGQAAEAIECNGWCDGATVLHLVERPQRRDDGRFVLYTKDNDGELLGRILPRSEDDFRHGAVDGWEASAFGNEESWSEDEEELEQLVNEQAP